MGMPIRILEYNFKTGSIPYSLVYKMHVIIGIPLSEIVLKHLAEEWLDLFNDKRKNNKPRGKKEAWQWGKSSKWSKNLELDTPPAGQAPEEKIEPVSRETKVTESSIPKTVTPPKPAKRSIADIMKANPPAAPAEAGEPDFSNIPDEVFATSMDQIPKKTRR